MTLAEYLSSHRLTYRQFAARIGRDGSEVWRWARGHRVPDLATAAAIERATDGSVAAISFVTDKAEASA